MFFRNGIIERVLLFAVALCAFSASQANAQMSPGELSVAHQDLDSPLKCTSCHAFGEGSAQFKCLDCHGEIRKLLDEKRGYHGKVVRGEALEAANDCTRCHAEHAGRKRELVKWKTPKARFDHREAGWALEGKHAQLKCEKCHVEKNISADERALIKRRDVSKSLLGLNPKCSNCHQDTHRGALGADCARCHSNETWKAPPKFSHEQTKYPLTGNHLKVACEKCHKRLVENGPVQYRNFAFFENCRACHNDPHGGAFPADCQKCHTTAGWKPAHSGELFQHDKTQFALKGKHAVVACKKCHKSENFKAPIAHARCMDCHKDEHRGQFATHAGGECSGCHTEAGWKPSTFDVTKHGESKYPLAGMHVKVPCAKCHSSMSNTANYHPAFDSCKNCHQDHHASQFAAAPHLNRCERCHAVDGWRPAKFTLADHRKTRFGLNGAHGAVLCADCHKAATPPEQVKYHFARLKCVECHEDPHGVAVAASSAPPRWSCDSCHTTKSWKETGPFDHAQTSYPLLGRHRAAVCTGCHKPAVIGEKKRISFNGTTKQCGSCHADVHDGQFAGTAQDQPVCGRCHTSTNWRPTEFDHHKHSSFSLAGAHERVPCRMCHANKRQTGKFRSVVYKGTPRQCVECHQ